MITYTPTEIAKSIRKRREYVVRMIEEGRLVAMDLSEPGSVKTIYRVSEESLNDFLNESKVIVRDPPATTGLPPVTDFV